jgi:hypothetical protein
MKRFYTASLIVMTIAAVVVTNTTALGQTARTFNAVTGDWNNSANWSGGFVPEASFDESATINNAASVAQVGGAVPAVAAMTVGPGAVTIASGGSLGTAPGATLGIGTATINANGRVAVASGGTFSPRALTLNGILELTGPNATVNVGNTGLAVNGGSTLLAKINSASPFKPVAVDGLARIRGGNLNVEFSGFTPTTANTFNLIDADAIDGSFDNVQVTGGAALQPYQVYAVNTHAGGANGTLATLQVDNRLVLSIDRATGIGTVMNMAPAAIDLDGYSVLSGLGSIAPTSFNSFDDQNLDTASWSEIGTQSATGIAELRSAGTTSLAAASSRAIGAIYSPDPPALGVDPEDLTFHYTNASGESVEGPVVYQGDKAFNNLVVNINPTTGAATLVNESPFTFNFDGYSVTSASGSLSTAGWTSLQDQAAGGGDWIEIPSTSNKVGELKRSGSTSLSQGTSFNLGTIFNPAGTRDLELQFIVSGEDAARTGDIDYRVVAAGVPGDYNENGTVDAADYVVWRNVTGTAATLPNRNPGQAGNIGPADYDFWRANFGSGSGIGSGALSASAAVPEPASVLLLTISGLLLSLAVSRPRR